MAMTKIKGLQLWCRKMTDGYPHVDIANFTTAWRNGMAFCAIIHRFRPDLIDYDSLSPENVFENCKLAFEVAERELDIPAFLEADDMARLKVPDKLSVITYVSQYYNFLNPLPQLGGPGVKGKVSHKATSGTKRPPDIDTSQAPSTKKATTTASKENDKPAADKSKTGSMGDKCSICQNRVYLLERHIEAGKLYHRSCYRHSDLSPTSKVYTRSPFLSPALSTEAPLSPSHTTSGTKSVQSDLAITRKIHKDVKPHQSDTDKSKSVSSIQASPRKGEGVGTKHSLTEPDREDSKKSKMQPKTLFGKDKYQYKDASAVKDRLESLRNKYTDNNTKGADSGLPLSGKEARKLEKRREEILASEKGGEAPRSTKRNVPLIFQQKDKEEEKAVSATAKNVLPTSKNVSVTSSKSGAGNPAPTAVLTSTSLKDTTAKTSNHSMPSKSDTGAAHKVERHAALKDSKTFVEDRKTDSLRRTDLPDIHNLQKMFSGKAPINEMNSAASSHPVAKPRAGAHKSASSDSHKHSAPSVQVSDSSVELRNKDSTPKPAPRKSLADHGEKRAAPERPKEPPQSRKLALNLDSSKEELNRSLSPGLGSPPPLPSSAPPPLPSSAPPPLPSTGPVGQVFTKTSETNSKASTAQITLGEIQAPPHNRKQPGLSKSALNTDLKTSAHKNSAGIKSKSSDKDSVEEITTHSPVKSQIAHNTAVVATSTPSKLSHKRMSVPVSVEQEPLAVFVVPGEKKEEGQVLTGLLASLAGVRGRAASVPGVTTLTSPPVASPSASPPPLVQAPVQSSTSSVSRPEVGSTSSSSSVSSTAHSKISNVAKSIDSKAPTTSVNSTSHVKPQSSKKLTDELTKSVSQKQQPLSHDKTEKGKNAAVAGLKSSALNTKTGSGTVASQNVKDVPEALSVLNSLKSVSGSTSPQPGNSDSKSEFKLSRPDRLEEKPKQLVQGDVKNVLKEDKSKQASSTVTNKSDITKEKNLAPKGVPYSLPGSKINLNVNKEERSENAKNTNNHKNVKLNPTPANGTASKGSSGLGKSKVLSSSKEDLLDMNSVKLKRVMPEQKEAKKGPTIPAFDVKLKKVDHKKEGDETGIQPPLITKTASESQSSKSNVSAKVNGEADKKSQFSSSNKFHSSNTNIRQDISEESSSSPVDDVPDWKKALEERKKKLRQDIAKTESEGVQVRRYKGMEEKKERPKSVDILNMTDNEDISGVSQGTPLRPKSSFIVPGRPKSMEITQTAEPDTNSVDHLNLKPEEPKNNEENIMKSNWQKEAELRMAALGGFDSEEEGKVKGDKKTKRALPKVPSPTSPRPSPRSSLSRNNKLDGGINTKSDLKLGVDDSDEVMTSEAKRTKLKDSELEYRVSQTKLKPVEVNIDISSSDSELSPRDSQSQDKPVSKEDFRDKLKHLKRVEVKDEKKAEMPKKNNRDNEVPHSLEKVEVNLSGVKKRETKLTLPLSLSNNNNNNNKINTSSNVKVTHVSDMQHIQRLADKGQAPLRTISLETSSESSGCESEDEVSKESGIMISDNKSVHYKAELDKNKETSPKLKRKITVLGRKKTGAVETPPQSPNLKKKIEVNKFDFEDSADLESSMTESTAKLTIHDKHTPPPRPPPPHPHEKVMSPRQISAIELQQQLLDIDSRLTDLELRGRDLEDSIRNVNTLEEDDDTLMIEWFKLVSEKNDLVRKEADLVYFSREQDLEGEQDQVESQLRYLISLPDHSKSPAEKEEEDYLLQRKLELVEQRNSIVDSMDEDRLRYEAEDRDIAGMLKDKGLWMHPSGTMIAEKGKKVAKSKFYT